MMGIKAYLAGSFSQATRQQIAADDREVGKKLADLGVGQNESEQGAEMLDGYKVMSIRSR
jgi:hypothetical protein